MTSTTTASVIDALAEVYDPELDEPITRLGFVSSCEVSRRRRRRGRAAAADAAVRAQLRVPDGSRRAQRRAPAARGPRGEHQARGPLHGRRDQRRARPRRRLHRCVPGRDRRRRPGRAARAVPAQGAGRAPVAAVRDAAEATGPPPRRSRHAASRTCPTTSPTRGGASSSAASSASRTTRSRRRSCCRTASRCRAAELKRWLRTARLVRMSLEVNGGICRSLLQIRHGVAIDDPEEVLR